MLPQETIARLGGFLLNPRGLVIVRVEGAKLRVTLTVVRAIFNTGAMLVVVSAIMFMVASDLFTAAVNDSRFIPPVVEGWAESACRHMTPGTRETGLAVSGNELLVYHPGNPRGCLDAHRREPFQETSDVTDEEIREMFDRLEEQ